MPVGALGDVEAMPVDDRWRRQVVREPDAHLLPAAKAERRPEVRVAEWLDVEAGPLISVPVKRQTRVAAPRRMFASPGAAVSTISTSGSNSSRPLRCRADAALRIARKGEAPSRARRRLRWRELAAGQEEIRVRHQQMISARARRIDQAFPDLRQIRRTSPVGGARAPGSSPGLMN